LLMRSFIYLLIICLSSVLSSDFSFGKDIHKEKSHYQNIVVRDKGDERCLLFSVKREDRNQTCMDLKKPGRLVFSYTRMSLGGLLLNQNPKKILIIGLGGGSIPNTLSTLYPNSIMDIVEIDSAVLRVAKTYFNFSETENVRVYISDARVFVKRAGVKKQHYDLIILDAFTGEYIPEHLMTLEFLSETKRLLTNKGVLVANTFSTSRLYDHESATYQKVFGDFLNFKMPNTGNRVILVRPGDPIGQEELRNAAKSLSAALFDFGVDIDRFPLYMSRHKDWRQDARPLSDQFNPANLLQSESY